MTKMTKTQRFAILAAHKRRTLGMRGQVHANPRTEHALRRDGWVTGLLDDPTRAALIAAGVDMDAIHAEALAEDEQRSTAAGMLARMSSEGRKVVIEAAHAEALAEDIARRGTTINDLADELGAHPHEVATFADLDEDTVL